MSKKNRKHAKPYVPTPFTEHNLPKIGQRVRVRVAIELHGGTTIPVGTLCDVNDLRGDTCDAIAYVSNGTARPSEIATGWVMVSLFESVRGKPFIPGIDTRRTNNPSEGAAVKSRRATPTNACEICEAEMSARAAADALLEHERVICATCAEAMTALDEEADDDEEGPVDAMSAEELAEAMGPKPNMTTRTMRSTTRGKRAGSVEEAIRTLVEQVAPSAALDEDKVKQIAMGVVKPVADALVEEIKLGAAQETRLVTLEGNVDALGAQVTNNTNDLALIRDALAAATPAQVARARMALSSGSASGNVLLDQLEPYYTPGTDNGVNVLLCSPPSLGKSYTARLLGTRYDAYFEHGCSDDMDEVATLLGSPIPDGHGGFVIVDGVLTQAMRLAAAGQSVLFLFDEILRLSPRAQEWLLTFLTGIKTPDGRVYRLRTRRAVADGSLEVIEAPAKHLHILAATNLGMLNPIEAFWSRFETVRVEFDVKNVVAIAQAITAAYGITDATALCAAWGRIVTESRQAVADGRLRFPADMRIFERGCAVAAEPTGTSVGAWIADRLTDNLAHWNIDTGDTLPESVAVCDSWRALLKANF